MNSSNRNPPLEKGFIVFWWIAFVMTVPLAARLLYERTILLWRDGDQAIGFTLAHRHPEILFLGLAGCVLLAVWCAIALISVVWRRKAPSARMIPYLLALPLIALICYPVF